MKTPYEPPILRTHRLITGQPERSADSLTGACGAPVRRPDPAPAAAPDIASAFVATVAKNLQDLARQAPTRLHIAPPREELHTRLRRAGQLAKTLRA